MKHVLKTAAVLLVLSSSLLFAEGDVPDWETLVGNLRRTENEYFDLLKNLHFTATSRFTRGPNEVDESVMELITRYPKVLREITDTDENSSHASVTAVNRNYGFEIERKSHSDRWTAEENGTFTVTEEERASWSNFRIAEYDAEAEIGHVNRFLLEFFSFFLAPNEFEAGATLGAIGLLPGFVVDEITESERDGAAVYTIRFRYKVNPDLTPVQEEHYFGLSSGSSRHSRWTGTTALGSIQPMYGEVTLLKESLLPVHSRVNTFCPLRMETPDVQERTVTYAARQGYPLPLPVKMVTKYWYEGKMQGPCEDSFEYTEGEEIDESRFTLPYYGLPEPDPH